MLASFTELQTGQEPRKASQALHEQRCLHGRKRTHDFLDLHHLQTIFFLSPSSSSTFSSLLQEPQIEDSASWAPLLTTTSLSLTCSSVLLRSTTIASFSFAILCHDSLSISAFLRLASSSIVFLVAWANTSSFCLIKHKAFDSKLFSTAASCCLLCSCRAHLSLSFCLKK